LEAAAVHEEDPESTGGVATVVGAGGTSCQFRRAVTVKVL
jgi:hypothetical protein